MTPQIIEGGLATDDRGTLRFVNSFDFYNIKRFYQVENHAEGFIRAWHGHLKEAKYVYVARGAAVVKAFPFDLDANKKAYPKESIPESFVLSDEKPSILYIPEGYMNGFKTLVSDTIIQFFSTTKLEESEGDDYRLVWDALGTEPWEEIYR